MPLVDTLTLLSFKVTTLACCMLVALGRLGAALRVTNVCSSLPPHLRLPCRPAAGSQRTQFGPATSRPPYLGHVARLSHLSNSAGASRSLATSEAMFKAAVKSHNAATPAQAAATPAKQQNILGAFESLQSTQRWNNTRPLSTLSGNVPKHNPERRNSGQSHGIKRTSSGLAKALGTHDDAFDYASMNITDFENEVPTSFHSAATAQSVSLANVLFDEDDFDSDIDLDVEDPATKSTVQQPATAQPSMVDSAYHSAQAQSPASKQTPLGALRSSQPIPWSSSPPEHFKTPPRPQHVPVPTKRRTLPWLQNGGQVKTEAVEDVQDEEPEATRPKKRRPVEAAAVATPAPKSSKPDYPWNTTQSAIKQQQKTLREASKKAATAKMNEGTDEDMKEAIKRKKKTMVHRIFLSEEQQNVLNMVVENKKSVFFTGSAGKCDTYLAFASH